MMIKQALKDAEKHLQALWNDKATVKRNVPIVKASGADGFEEQAVLVDIPCHYSQTPTSTNQTETTNNIEYEHALFYSKDIELMPGDKIVVTIKETGITREFERASEPVIRFSHNRITLTRTDKA